jgi:glycosyltransferase involved in cell wall biosynthesis
MVALSVVIPVFNEKESLHELYEGLSRVLQKVGREYEIIFVDDGSTDGSFEYLKKLHEKDGKVKVLKLRENYGKTIALVMGFKKASGGIVITLDADLQDDPEDIPRLLEKMSSGYDMVVGWRRQRMHELSKKLPSKVFNTLLAVFFKSRIHDTDCPLKAFKKNIAEIRIYGDLHRYQPVLASMLGYRVAEIEVNHRPRVHGKSKYGVSRLPRGLMDLLTVKFLMTYASRPLHLFGVMGFTSGLLGFLISVYMVYLRLLGEKIGDRPLLILGVLLMVLGAQFISIGLLGELSTNQYYDEFRLSGGREHYVEEVLD